MTPQEAYLYLDSFINYELAPLAKADSKKLTLKRVEHLLKELGQPDKHLRCLHVAGTKGKGSTCAFLAQILSQAGFRTGLYSSPHLYHLRERIRVLDSRSHPLKAGEVFADAIREEEFAALLTEMKPCLESLRDLKDYGVLTYFEVLTALALVFFSRQTVDYVILETGMGGRLDATNAVTTLVCGITPISLDHTKFLGETIPEIAAEKAAIIKSANQKVLVGKQVPEAKAVIAERCQLMGCRAYYLEEDVKVEIIHQDDDAQEINIYGLQGQYRTKTSMLGEYQSGNAALAVGMAEALALQESRTLNPDNIDQGIRKTFLPARFEIVRRDPHVILDCAHNPESINQLIKTVRQVFPKRIVHAVLGFSQDKEWPEMLQSMCEVAQKMVLAQSQHQRAKVFSEKELSTISPKVKASLTANISEAVEQALTNAQREDIVLVTGSVFIAAEARKYIMEKESQP